MILSNMQFITQPFGQVRLGDFLMNHLADPQWTSFRAAVAFVRRSGTQYIYQPLREYCARADSSVRISVGVDLLGTSKEGLSDLLEATGEGSVFIYRNNGPFTFHPKVYLFRSTRRADVLVGSGNLTQGGMFTNYEAALLASLDLDSPHDRTLLQAVEDNLDAWTNPQQGTCYALTAEFIEKLVASGLVRSEAELISLQPIRTPEKPLIPPSGRSPISLRLT
jgi:HKD family nuclease